MSAFATVPEQREAKRLLTAALAEGPAHAYLFHGPAGVGKRAAAFAFAAELLGDERRVLDRTHPDLYVVEALGEFIRIDDVRALHHDLHMRPYEGDRRVYLVLDAHRLNDDAADALLKDLEEPPAYATIALVADELGSLPETIHSRCQLVPFGRLSETAVRDWLAQRAPALTDRQTTALARVAGGRLDRAARLLDPEAGQRRDVLIEAARNVYLDAEFEPADAAEAIIAGAVQRGAAAKELEQQSLEDRDLPAREAEQRLRRVQRGAEREELLASLEELAAWYRDLVVVGAGADGAVLHADRLDDLRGDAARIVGEGADRAAELCRETWRAAEEFNVNASLALEALFVQLRSELAAG